MNPWIIIALIGAVLVFLVDFLFRRKKWKNNTKSEKISLIIHMFLLVVYVFVSGLGLLWGITGNGADTAFGNMLYNVTLTLIEKIWVVALVVTIGSFILRKAGKVKMSIWSNIFTIGYIVILFLLNSLSGQF